MSNSTDLIQPEAPFPQIGFGCYPVECDPKDARIFLKTPLEVFLGENSIKTI